MAEILHDWFFAEQENEVVKWGRSHVFMYVSIIMHMDNGIGFQTLLPRLKPNGVILKNGVIIKQVHFSRLHRFEQKGYCLWNQMCLLFSCGKCTDSYINRCGPWKWICFEITPFRKIAPFFGKKVLSKKSDLSYMITLSCPVQLFIRTWFGTFFVTGT